ncbi:flagellar biosynthesis anti-sigma factor FlgM [Photobacterium aphoticum]|uniref:Negative regulator of flagellin synthesis n=1 Tax=Photobacterium aphoticum TaxID=754436 RepID=A0A090RH31_9GAMM|nr:flagellar biosynthesis anti-sigma factor FlgM [Photobacterium aphoticum]KLV02565.1 flagellar biosynthesis anti-sigma factor FlgM [Photobacterium aphoticum]PSU55087.1 flagellar biosynthesis anti-sigma factor FlgM [Photobacterium aphoticum]GAL06862.1 negative regulator of flagellin synthesis FlgM [Photobacterium aphoticum]GHA47256.1 flagellar biosynthesis anti-sigma factor FlgM [Photobacterium aphoticum]
MASIDAFRSGQPLTARNVQNTTTGSSSATAKGATHAASAHHQSDAVSLSSQGKAVGQIHQQLAAEPSFDSVKVEAIKNAIANGSYVVDAEKLAANIMKFEDELRGM